MSTETIREFLVSLGFKSDEAALKKFENGINQATKAVTVLAVAVEAAAVSVAYGVARMANNLEQLYFATLRTDSSATSLKALARASRDVGSSASDAMGSVEGLARFMRNNPYGGEAQLNQWLGGVGKSTRDANGHLLSTTTILEELGEVFKKNTREGNTNLNNSLASQWGITEKQMLAMQNPDFGKRLASATKRWSGADLPEATKNANKFMDSLRDLGDSLEVLGIRIVGVLEVKFGHALDRLTAWADRDGPRIADKVANFIGQIVDGLTRIIEWLTDPKNDIGGKVSAMFDQAQKAADLIKPALQWLWEKFVQLDAATDGWSTKMLVALGVLKALGGTQIIAGVISLAAGITRLGVGLVGLGAGTAATAGGGGLLAALGLGGLAVGAGVGLGALLDLIPGIRKLGEDFGGLLFQGKNPLNDNIERLTNHGFSRSQAIGIASNLWSESSNNAGAHTIDSDGKEHYGLAQWSPDRQAAFAKFTGHDIHGSTDEEQIAFIAQEMQHSTDPRMQRAWSMMQASKADTGMNADLNARIFSRYFERPADGDEQSDLRGRRAMSIQQQTSITVTGSGDPHATAQAVAAEQTRVNQNLTRNVQPTVQ